MTSAKDRRRDSHGRYAVVVAGICMSDDSVILVRRSRNDPHMPGRWSVPGGHMRQGESPLAALRREIMEETGIKVGAAALVGTSMYVESEQDGNSVPVLQLNYLIPCPHHAVDSHTSEIADATWVQQSDFAKFEIDEFTRAVLEQGSGQKMGAREICDMG